MYRADSSSIQRLLGQCLRPESLEYQDGRFQSLRASHGSVRRTYTRPRPMSEGTDVKTVTLLTMIASWVVKGSTHYPEMFPMQHLPYISNIGASDWGHPLFIVGSAATAILFSIAFVSERWLRHTSHLIHSSSVWGTFFWSVAALLTTLGTCAQVLLTVFCIRRHAYTHYCMVAVFA